MDDYKNTIIQGDTLQVLKSIPANIFDIGVTSPPYNKQEKNKGWLVKNVVYDTFKDVLPESEYQENQINVLNELFRVTKTGGHFFYNHKIRWVNGTMIHPMEWLLKTDWCVRQEIIWDRKIAGNIRGWRFWQVDERVYWLYKPDKNNIGVELNSKHALMTSIWRLSPENNNPHPAPFPISLPIRIIYSILDEEVDKMVIDPYMGSGTTAIASRLLKHNYCGIEISKDYISLAKERVLNCNEYSDILTDETNKHKVEKTFTQRKQEKATKQQGGLI